MRWYISRPGGQDEGPFEEHEIIASLRAGHYGGAVVAPEGTREWKALSAHPPFAAVLDMGRGGVPAAATPGGGSEAIGVMLLLTPLITTALIWFWVSTMTLLQDPSSTLVILSVGTVILTAVLMAVEASQLGMGKVLNARGKRDNGPVTWFVAGMMIWIVVYPYYLGKRSQYGRTSYAVGGLLAAFVFLGSSIAMNAAIEAQKAEVREKLENLQNLFQQ